MSSSESKFRTPQEEFWAGSFGDEYIQRNTAELFLAANIAMFANIFRHTGKLASVIELGANIGLNLRAIHCLQPIAQLNAIEINQTACQQLAEQLPQTTIHATSILDFEPHQAYDLAFIKGVLIHINPDQLPAVYDKLAALAARYVLIAEYYNPVPVTISYRGHTDRLFKRDFAGEFLDRHPEFRIVDYAFVWRRDPMFPQDDTTWFLLERQTGTPA